MEYIELRGCIHGFTFDYETNEYKIANDDIDCLIYASCEEQNEDYIFDYLCNETIYNQLMNFINESNNYSLLLTRVEGTTMDFILIKNKVFGNSLEMLEWLGQNHTKENETFSYKYVMVDYNTKVFERFNW